MNVARKARDVNVLQRSEPIVRVDVVATDAEVDSILQAMRRKSQSESG